MSRQKLDPISANNWSNQKNVNNKSCHPQLILLNKSLFQKNLDIENEKFTNFDGSLIILDKELKKILKGHF